MKTVVHDLAAGAIGAAPSVHGAPRASSKKTPLRPWNRAYAAITLIVTSMLVACSSAPERPRPADLPPAVALLAVQSAWTVRLGPIEAGHEPRVADGQVGIALADGTLVVLNGADGSEAWRASAGAQAASPAGGDGRVWALVTRTNDVVALSAGRVLWRTRLNHPSMTAPLVAGGRVFVLGSDRSVTAIDAANGALLWAQTRPSSGLVLRQAGVLLAVGNTLVVGQSGRLQGLNPDNGATRWEAAIATPRGVNDIERLVDMVGRVSRVGDTVCARAYQAALGCIDAARGAVQWTQRANAAEGVHGNDQVLVGTEANGVVLAFQRADGERAWSVESLRHRQLSAPLVAGRSVLIGDSTGAVHVLSAQDGSPLNRLSTDNSGVAAAPVLVRNTVVVVSRAGGVYAFRPQ
jgi:outer membrane protein assembly factor BamB